MNKTLNKIYEKFYIFIIILIIIVYIFSEKYFTIINNIFYPIFIVDYIIRLLKNKNKLKFIFKNPIDLIVILPFSHNFRILGLYRLIKITGINEHINKKFPKIKNFLKNNNLGNIILWLFYLIFIFSYLILIIEETKINNYADAIWWSIVTTTTVGYGDIYPETLLGRLIAIIMMILGIGIMGLVTNNIIAILSLSKNSNISNDISNLLLDFNKLEDKNKEKVIKRLNEEIELHLYKQNKRKELKNE